MVNEMTEKREMPNVKRLYLEKVQPELLKKFGYGNIMEAPRLSKIIINMGVGEGIQDAKVLEADSAHVSSIAVVHPKHPLAAQVVDHVAVREEHTADVLPQLRADTERMRHLVPQHTVAGYYVSDRTLALVRLDHNEVVKRPDKAALDQDVPTVADVDAV